MTKKLKKTYEFKEAALLFAIDLENMIIEKLKDSIKDLEEVDLEYSATEKEEIQKLKKGGYTDEDYGEYFE